MALDIRHAETERLASELAILGYDETGLPSPR